MSSEDLISELRELRREISELKNNISELKDIQTGSERELTAVKKEIVSMKESVSKIIGQQLTKERRKSLDQSIPMETFAAIHHQLQRRHTDGTIMCDKQPGSPRKTIRPGRTLSHPLKISKDFREQVLPKSENTEVTQNKETEYVEKVEKVDEVINSETVTGIESVVTINQLVSS